MKATDLLEAQHREVAKLFERLESSTKEEERHSLFEELARAIGAHDAIEREIFYPACEEKMGLTSFLGDARIEHGAVELSLYLADEARGGDNFAYYVAVLRDLLAHHVKEEEEALFPRIEGALSEGRLEELGAEMEARLAEAKEDDFRGPLQKSLRLVIDGEMEALPVSEQEREIAVETGKKMGWRAARAAV